jgi:hypothetical protein
MKIKNRFLNSLIIGVLFIIAMLLIGTYENDYMRWWQYISLFIFFVAINYFFREKLKIK